MMKTKALVSILALVGTVTLWIPATAAEEPALSYIVQGQGRAAAERVLAAGGEITHDLGLIHAVGARLTPTQVARLEQDAADVRIYPNRRTVRVAARVGTGLRFTQLIGLPPR